VTARGAAHRHGVRRLNGEDLVSNHSRHPPILIAISWQALNRALSGRADTKLCDCTVVILFAGFYLEANLNDLIQRLGRTREMQAFLRKQHPGLGDKLAWFYNEYVARVKAVSKDDFKRKGVHRKVRTRFPGFAKLYRFRNDLAHGVVNSSAQSLTEAQRLRTQAKDIVRSLFKVAERRGHVLPQSTDYYRAIGLTGPGTPPNFRLQPAAAGAMMSRRG
jgi:hypothetical protein